jgi:hypothetical protein
MAINEVLSLSTVRQFRNPLNERDGLSLHNYAFLTASRSRSSAAYRALLRPYAAVPQRRCYLNGTLTNQQPTETASWPGLHRSGSGSRSRVASIDSMTLSDGRARERTRTVPANLKPALGRPPRRDRLSQPGQLTVDAPYPSQGYPAPSPAAAPALMARSWAARERGAGTPIAGGPDRHASAAEFAGR